MSCCHCDCFQCIPSGSEIIQQLRKEGSAVDGNANLRQSLGPVYVNMPSAGFRGHPRDERGIIDEAKSYSVDSIADEAAGDDSLDLVITEPHDTPLTNSQKRNCCIS